MNLFESTRIALRALAANKLRAVLTMLGIIIGVAAVIALVSAGAGLQTYVTGQFSGLGSNLLFVTPGQFQGGPASRTANSNGDQSLTDSDAEALLDPLAAPDVAAVSPEMSGTATVIYGRESRQLSVSGVTPAYSVLQNAMPAVGSFITDQDVTSRSRVAVLGSDVVADLFPDNPLPVGETIRINDVAFRVVGVMESKGGTGFGSQDNVVFIPLSTAQTRIFRSRGSGGDFEVSLIYVQAVAAERTDAAADQVSEVLRQRRDIGPDDDDDFSVTNQAALISSFTQVLGTLTLFLGAIAAISLLVGGIGIMNIMLVSVTERTREIGLRKAVGARRRDILSQFLVESVVLSVVGGAIGIVLGGLGAQAISLVAPEIIPVLSLSSIALATGFSAGVGLFFGIYPAARAASLDPIAALRYE